MRAAVLEEQGKPLRVVSRAAPEPGPGQVLIDVEACGLCRTDLHLRDGEIAHGGLPRVLGHQVVGRVAVTGQRVGVPWLGWTCGSCRPCVSGHENLCEHALFTGRDVDGGFAEQVVADHRYCLALPESPALQLAPLLCGGLIGYRAYRMAGEQVERIGLYGFGSAAHLITQVAIEDGCAVYAFTRRGNDAAAQLARSLGAVWVGASDEPPPERLDAAIIFASDGALVPRALRSVRPGGTVVCAGIHMSDIPSFAYSDLWEERTVKSVANLTREDGRALLARSASLRVEATAYPLEEAETALADLRAGKVAGSAVLTMRGASSGTT